MPLKSKVSLIHRLYTEDLEFLTHLLFTHPHSATNSHADFFGLVEPLTILILCRKTLQIGEHSRNWHM